MRLPETKMKESHSIFLLRLLNDFLISLLKEQSMSMNEFPEEFLDIDICLTISKVLKLLDQLGF